MRTAILSESGAGFVIDSGRHGHARGSCRTYGRKERAHRSLQNHRTVLHKLPHASSSCPIRRPKHQNLSGCWVATHRFCGGGEERSIPETLQSVQQAFRVPGQNPGVEERIAKVARERVGKMMDKWVGHE